MPPHVDGPAQQPGPPCPADRVALGTLTHTYPPELVDQVLAACGRVERRHRLLPGWVEASVIIQPTPVPDRR
jgi:hypothetical protein